jgi:OmpA-OmpF porin, OOP family
MKSHKIIAIVAVLVCTQAAAQGANVPEAGNGWQMPYQSAFWRYAAVTVGRSVYDFDCARPASLPCDTRDDSVFKLAAGGKFNSTWGVEISYVNFGDVSPPALQAHTRAQGANLSLVASAKVFDRVGINAKIGGVYGWTRSRLRAANISCILGTGPDVGCNLSQSDRGFGASYGAGLSARVAPRVELRLDWDRYRLPFGKDGLFSQFARVGGKRDVDMWSVGFNVLF